MGKAAKLLRGQLLRMSTGQLVLGSLGLWLGLSCKPDLGPALLVGLSGLGILNFVWLRIIGE